MSFRLWLLPFTLLAWRAQGQAREIGSVAYVAPAAWNVDERPNVHTLTHVRGNDRCMALIGAEEPAPGGLDAAFNAAWTAIFSPNNYPSANRPRASVETSPSGQRHMVGEGDVEDRGGNRMVARVHVFPVGDRSQTMAWIGSSRAAFGGCRSGFGSLLASLKLRSASETPVTPRAAPSDAPPKAAAPNDTRVSTGAPERFENVTFTPPTGWSMRRERGIVQLAPPPSRREESLRVLMLPGRPAAGGFARVAQETWGELQQLLGVGSMRNVSGREFDLGEVLRTLHGWEYVTASGGMLRQYERYSVDVYLVRAGDRIERVAVVGSELNIQLTVSSTNRKPEYARAIRHLVFGMRFANQPNRELAPARLTGGGIVGVWTGLGMSFGRIKQQYAIFFDNGLAYYGAIFPIAGLESIDAAVEETKAPRYWGSWSMPGSSGRLVLPYDTVPMRRDRNAVVLRTNNQDHRFIRMELPSNNTLDGTYCLSEGQCIRFDASGRFEDRGAVRIIDHETYPWPESPLSGDGRYELKEHTLTLRYTGGLVLRIGYPGSFESRSSSPPEIRVGFNGDVLKRR